MRKQTGLPAYIFETTKPGNSNAVTITGPIFP